MTIEKLQRLLYMQDSIATLDKTGKALAADDIDDIAALNIICRDTITGSDNFLAGNPHISDFVRNTKEWINQAHLGLNKAFEES
jgi:hypothetical protein